ncbi:MAG TPA: ATP-binding protein [Thermoanaerobaculia bacterium]|jgi:signal transduction histidine kinase/ActR/RegA family two-component response regulator|nr:ATP-binding protein [Thermoanaerobaculia bacterium]
MTLPSLRIWTRDNTVAIAATVLFIVIAVNGLISFREVTTVVEKFEAVRRSSNTLAELGDTISPLRDAGAGERTFLLTGRSEYLEPYFAARPVIDIHLRRLELLVADDAAQRARVRDLRVRIDAKLNDLDKTLTTYRSRGRQAALQEAMSDPGNDPMLAIRRVEAEIQRKEVQTRSTQRMAATMSSEKAQRMVALTSMVAVLMLLLTLAQIGQTTRAEHTARERAEAAHAAEIKARVASDAANRVKDDFIASVSHELRTPLTAILGWSKILTATTDPEEMKEGLQAIHSCASTQKKLIDDLLDVSRITSGKLRLSIRTINVAEVTRAGVDSVRPAAQAKGIEVAIHVDERIRMAADPDRLQQIIWNLVSNAVKFTPRGGSINVRIQRSDSRAIIEVNDSGEGIVAEFLPHVFEPFRQADASKAREHKGLGLGLSIVKSLVEAHGGTISVSSAGKGEGTTFRVALPIMPFTRDGAEGSDPAGGSTEDHWPIVLPDGDALAGLTILVVDDHPPTLDLLTSVLQHCSAKVLATASAAEGLRLLTTLRPDVLLSDIGMPQEDGFAFINNVRQLPRERGGQTPAIALTAYVRDDDRAKVLSSGFQMYLAKPIDPLALVAAIREVAARQWVIAEPGGERPPDPAPL